MTKKLLVTASLLLTLAVSVFAQGISIAPTSTPPDPSAGLDVNFNDRGVLIPRLTTAERDAIVDPAVGLHIFNIETGCFNMWSGTTWRKSCYECDFNAPTVGNNGPVCEGSTINLTATTISGATYAWTGPNGFSSSSQNPSISNVTAAANGVYSVVVTLNGCSANPVTTVVTVNNTPQTPTADNDGPVCAGSNLSLTASSIFGATYVWSGPNGYTANTQNPIISNTGVNQTGTYSVTATVNGCSSAAGSTSVTIYAIPSSPVASSNSPVCDGTTLNLTASSISNATYSWTGPGGYTASTQNPSVSGFSNSGVGTYSVTATVNGCTSAAASTSVSLNAIPSAPGAITGSSSGCANLSNEAYTINAVSGATSYTWTVPSGYSVASGQGTTSATINIGSSTGNICVTSDNACGSSSATCKTYTVTGGGGGSQTFNPTSTGRTGSIQTFTVPTCVTSITIEAWGAQGGSSAWGGAGGKGARMKGDFAVTPGDVLQILVGQRTAVTANWMGGGGGGSFVALGSHYSSATPLIIAGGGGGAGQAAGKDAEIGTSGSSGSQNGGAGGTSGNGGSGSIGAGGAGYNSNGGIGGGYNGMTTAKAFVNGGEGGQYDTGYSYPTVTEGGFGGGGGAAGSNHGGGGGGGYSGGGGGGNSNSQQDIGGGGGSYNIGANQSNSAGVQTGAGQVIITW